MAKLSVIAILVAVVYSAEAFGSYGEFNATFESFEEVSSKIVGGTQAKKNEFPYQLRMLVKRGSSTALCGASIIKSEWALTAAHCLSSKPTPSDVTLNVGYLDTTRKTGGEYDVKGAKILVHPDYDSDTQANDIALVKISGTFQNTAGSKPIPLVAQGARPTGDAIATGWGTTRENGQTSKILMKVTLPILADSSCSKVYGSYDSNKMLCAGVLAGGKDTCQGDSGGPLVLDGTQVGVVSFGAGCARKNYPGVYTRVSTYRDWIDQNTK